jgi:uncharacterized membrane protein
MCGLIRRYGASEPTVAVALLRLLTDCASFVWADAARQADIRRETDLILADAERAVTQPADLQQVRDAAARLTRRPG